MRLPLLIGLMMVRDEEKQIERTLASFSPYIDRWIIHDTGSVDNTIEVMKNWFKKHHINYLTKIKRKPWIDYGYNRNLLLEDAKYTYNDDDYYLMIDAADTIVGGEKLRKAILMLDANNNPPDIIITPVVSFIRRDERADDTPFVVNAHRCARVGLYPIAKYKYKIHEQLQWKSHKKFNTHIQTNGKIIKYSDASELVLISDSLKNSDFKIIHDYRRDKSSFHRFYNDINLLKKEENRLDANSPKADIYHCYYNLTNTLLNVKAFDEAYYTARWWYNENPDCYDALFMLCKIDKFTDLYNVENLHMILMDKNTILSDFLMELLVRLNVNQNGEICKTKFSQMVREQLSIYDKPNTIKVGSYCTTVDKIIKKFIERGG